MLAGGGLVAFPTETVYGLGADGLSDSAVLRIFQAKGRPASDPLILHVSDLGGLEQVVTSVPDVARELVEAFWPGPLTLVLPRRESVPAVVTAGLDSVAVRSPAHPVALALIESFGGPVAAPSANLFGRTSPTTAAHVLADLGSRVDMILDAGPTRVGVESTVLDCRSSPPVVLRPGGLPLESLAPWGVRASKARTTTEPARSPGQMLRHYAPRATVVLLDVRREGGAAVKAHPPTAERDAAPDADVAWHEGAVGTEEVVATAIFEAARLTKRSGLAVAVLAADEDRPRAGAIEAGVHVLYLASLGEPDVAARRLFAAMRELDGLGVDVIMARTFGRRGLGLAVRDRLLRAAEGRIVYVTRGRGAGAAAREAAELAISARRAASGYRA